MEDLRELLGWLENQAWKKGEEQRAPSHSSHMGHSGLPGPGEAAAAAAPEHPMAPQACPPAPATTRYWPLLLPKGCWALDKGSHYRHQS